MKIKYTQDIPFPEALKIRDHLPCLALLKNKAIYTKPFCSKLPEMQSPNRKLLDLKLNEFSTLLKKLQASIPQTKQTLSSNPNSMPKFTQKEQMTLPSSLQSRKPIQDTQGSPKQRSSRSPTKPPLLWKPY